MLFEATLKLSGLLAKPQTNPKQHIAPTLNSRQTSATQTPFINQHKTEQEKQTQIQT
jgi:hypothetical protein